MEKALRALCEQAKINLDDAVFSRLSRHWDLVKAANARFNLTAILEDSAAAEKHYLDCLLALATLDPLPGPWCDLGSGGGFPGLVLAAARPEREIFLVEATEKKCAFLAEAAVALGLDRVRVMNARAEEAAELQRIAEEIYGRA